MRNVGIARVGGIALIVLSLAPCAVAPASPRPSAPRVTPAAYRARANAICADLNRFQIPVRLTFVQGMQAALKKSRAAITALRKLEPPRSLAPLHAEAVRVEARYVEYFASLLAKVQAHTLTPSKMIAALARSADARQAAALWRKLGATVCAET